MGISSLESMSNDYIREVTEKDFDSFWERGQNGAIREHWRETKYRQSPAYDGLT